ncbi:hypothetical protein NPIL_405621, partial [Nephila pilipes]
RARGDVFRGSEEVPRINEGDVVAAALGESVLKRVLSTE